MEHSPPHPLKSLSDVRQNEQVTHMTKELRSREKIMMNVEELAALLGVSKDLIYEMVRAGELPAVRLGKSGGRILFRIQAIAEWIVQEEKRFAERKTGLE